MKLSQELSFNSFQDDTKFLGVKEPEFSWKLLCRDSEGHGGLHSLMAMKAWRKVTDTITVV